MPVTDEEDLMPSIDNELPEAQQSIILPGADQSNKDLPEQVAPVQLHNCYVLSSIKTGFILIDQQAASERILYERYLKILSKDKPNNTQQLLFPQNIDLSRPDAELLKQILPDINALGYDIAEFGQHTFVLRGIPSDTRQVGKEQQIIEQLLEQFKLHLTDLKTDHRDVLAFTMARSNALKKGEKLPTEQLRTLVDQLFACGMPYFTPNGKPTFVKYALEDIEKQFERKKG